MLLTLSNPQGGNAYLKDAVATGTIKNSDQMPRAWAVRFGRTVGAQVIDAVTERVRGGGGNHVTVGGVSLAGGAAPEENDAYKPLGLPEWDERMQLDGEARTMTMRGLVEQSAFHLSTGNAGAGAASFTAWGRFVASGFRGVEDDLTLDGNVTSGMLGADARWERLLAGVMLSQSSGEGGYQSPSDTGKVRSSLMGVYPYASLALSERVSLWGVVGRGSGDLTLRPEGKDSMSTDLSLRMGAVGVAGQVLDGSGPNGLSLNVRSDAMWIRTKTAKTAELVDTEGDVSRVRLILEGERLFPIGEAASLVPHAEIGVRVDGGDAETGAGIELGAGATYQAGAFIVATAERRANGLPHIMYRAGPLEDNVPGEHSIRQKVCRILEGGSDAFRRREQRYALPDGHPQSPPANPSHEPYAQ